MTGHETLKAVYEVDQSPIGRTPRSNPVTYVKAFDDIRAIFGETRDAAARNLRAFDFLHRYARREEDQQFLEKWRPYILRVNASAAVMRALGKEAYDEALRLAQEGLQAIERLEDMDDETFQFEKERSVSALQELAAQIQKNRPLSELERLNCAGPSSGRSSNARPVCATAFAI